MAQDPDFHGDRLRLSAFLRVIGDGMPQQPSRCRRRVPLTHNSSESLDLFNTALQTNVASEFADEGHIRNASVVDNPCSPMPKHLVYRPVFLQPAPLAEKDGSETTPTENDPATSVSPLERRESIAKTIQHLKVRTKTSTTQRKRYLPVNQLTLLRATSSDGLPEPGVR